MHSTSWKRLPACAVTIALTIGAPQARGQNAPATGVAFATANASITKFPARIPKSGPTALHIQILLDRAHFSPGIIDGSWGNNAARALAFFANPDGVDRLTGGTPALAASIDKVTYEKLRAAAGSRSLLRRYTLTSADVGGPFTPIPAIVYDQAKLRCLCYSSAAEAIAERFHTSPRFLAELNPRVQMQNLRAGSVLLVPNVMEENVASSMDTVIVAKLVISKTGFWTHAVDADGKIVAHYPSTLGSGYDPSPTGKFSVTYISRDPAFHYQPRLFSEVPDDNPEARLPPGPNSPVGRVWMSLSKPHYGIHGTSSPETIGYANSHGCVRLTNWDVIQLSDMTEPGTPVEFH
jgi:lipoprotein-anchoring transpeptidase ErfK/SrfK